jgi:HAD superfamily hydrolase (TIGR01509 family)
MELHRPITPRADAFDALIFDCDGTLADSMPLHFEAWNAALARWNRALPEKDFYGWAGMPIARIVERLNADGGSRIPVEEFVVERERRYFEFLPRVRPVPYVLEQVLRESGRRPMAVVSGSPRESVLKTLSALGVADRFKSVIGGDDLPRGKPAPDGFLLAARELGADPARCLVYEDADLGIEAARAAGMASLRVPTAPGYPTAITESARFWLREIVPADAEEFFALNSDPEVVRYTGDGPFASLEAARGFLLGYADYARFKMGRWAVIDKASGENLGWCGLKTLETGEVDLGYRLHRRHWGQGVATETSRAALDYGFRVLGLREIIAQVVPANVASARVLEKLGLRRVAERARVGEAIADKYALQNPA